MKKVLVIHSSPNAEKSVSRQVTHKIIDQLKAKHGQVEVIERDLDQNQPGHITGAHVGAFYTPDENLSIEQKNLLKASDSYVADLFAADIIVIGTPMWNFNIPSVLKAWIDHVIRVNKTFSFAGGALNSLVQGKKCYLALSSGSVFSSGAFMSYNHQGPYLRSVLGFIGITDITEVVAEGTNTANLTDMLNTKIAEQIAKI